MNAPSFKMVITTCIIITFSSQENRPIQSCLRPPSLRISKEWLACIAGVNREGERKREWGKNGGLGARDIPIP